jgi:hypothetical protein
MENPPCIDDFQLKPPFPRFPIAMFDCHFGYVKLPEDSGASWKSWANQPIYSHGECSMAHCEKKRRDMKQYYIIRSHHITMFVG